MGPLGVGLVVLPRGRLLRRLWPGGGGDGRRFAGERKLWHTNN